MPIYVHDCFRFVWLSPQDSAGNMPDYTAIQHIATAELPLATVAMRRIRLNLTKSESSMPDYFFVSCAAPHFPKRETFVNLRDIKYLLTFKHFIETQQQWLLKYSD